MTGRGGYAQREPGSLKEAQALLVMACGGQRRAAEISRVGATQMGRYTLDSEQHETTHMPVDVVLALELHCREPIVTRYLAAMEGRALLSFPLPVDRASMHERLARLGEADGKAIAECSRALQHGKLDSKRVPRVRRACLESMAALASLLEALPHA